MLRAHTGIDEQRRGFAGYVRSVPDPTFFDCVLAR